MPPCDATYLVGYLFEIGPTLGETPLTHSEIEAWMRNTGIRLSTWEARVLKRLSIEYLDESRQATDAARPSPWSDAPYAKPDPVRVGDTLKASMRELAGL